MVAYQSELLMECKLPIKIPANTAEKVAETIVKNAFEQKDCALKHNLLVEQVKQREKDSNTDSINLFK